MLVNDTTTLEIELLEVHQHGASQSPYQFSLKFGAPLSAPRQQGTFTLRHQTLGEQFIFLVPTAMDNERLYYEAVFNNPQN